MTSIDEKVHNYFARKNALLWEQAIHDNKMTKEARKAGAIDKALATHKTNFDKDLVTLFLKAHNFVSYNGVHMRALGDTFAFVSCEKDAFGFPGLRYGETKDKTDKTPFWKNIAHDELAITSVLESDKAVSRFIAQCAEHEPPYPRHQLTLIMNEYGYTHLTDSLWIRKTKEITFAVVHDKELHVLVFPYTYRVEQYATECAALLAERVNFFLPQKVGIGLCMGSLSAIAGFPFFGYPWLMPSAAAGAFSAWYYAKGKAPANRLQNQKFLREQYGWLFHATGKLALEFVVNITGRK